MRKCRLTRRPQLVTKGVPLFWNKSHTFPAWTCVQTMTCIAASQDFDPCRSQSGLVYLTWTTLWFQPGYIWAVEEAAASYTFQTLSCTTALRLLVHEFGTEPRRYAYSRAPTVSLFCISLYDVNSSDWTVKNCVQCLTVQSLCFGYGGA